MPLPAKLSGKLDTDAPRSVLLVGSKFEPGRVVGLIAWSSSNFDVSRARVWIKNARLDKSKLVSVKSYPATASEPVNPLTTMDRLKVTDEPGLTAVLLVGEKLTVTVPSAAFAVVKESAKAARTSAKLRRRSFFMGLVLAVLEGSLF